MDVPHRRIDDRLRRLCAKALSVSDGEREPILQELLELVHQKSERLKRRAARLLLKGEHLEPERRSTHVVDAKAILKPFSPKLAHVEPSD